MVAKIISGKSIIGMLNYNEHKVREGLAECIMASKYGQEPKDMNFYEKLERLEHLAEQNSRSKTNAIHISLNFDVGENISKEQLHSIASRYMDGIGFGEQPFLVYQHHDAGHPHIHIATTNIQPDGKRIDIHNLGRNQSEEARKAIEIEFGLVKAESKKHNQEKGIRAINPEKIAYGKTDTKRAITNVVGAITKQYNFTSLAELNAVLRRYNVIADRGQENTRMFQKKGLVYQVINEQGEKIGIPIKASTIYGKPTLDSLEKQFQENEQHRQYPRAMLKNTLDKIFHINSKMDKATFINLMKKEQVDVIFRQNSQGLIYGLTFIDHKNKAVFKGSDVAAHYSAKKILDKLEPGHRSTIQENPMLSNQKQPSRTLIHEQNFEPINQNSSINLLDTLLPDRQAEGNVDGQFKRKKKRKHHL